MAQPTDDARSVSSRNVPISVASSSNTSNTSTLPRIVGMSHRYRHIPDHEVMSPNSSLTRDAGQVTRQPPLQSQSQQQLHEGVTAQHPPATPVSRLTDLTTIPEGIVRATASVYSMFRRGGASIAGTSPSHTPRQDQEEFVPRYQNEASDELERLYGEDWRNINPSIQGDNMTEQQQNEFHLIRLQRDALLSENLARDSDLRRVINEHSMQTTSLQEAIRSLEATRLEQQELQRLADEREDELMQLRLQQGVVTGVGQAPGLPNPCGMRMLEQAAQLQQREPLIRDTRPEDDPNVLGGLCVGHLLQGTPLQSVLGDGNRIPTSAPTRNSPPPPPPRPASVRMSHEGGPMPVPEGTPTARFPTPTLGDLRGLSSSSLPTTNRLSHSGYSWNENPYSWNESHSGGSGPVPLAASVRPTSVPRSANTGAPTLADLKKTKTTLPVLQLKGNAPFHIIKQWKEWTLSVQAHVAGWNERMPAYWVSVLDKATTAYSQYCSLSPVDRQMFEASEQMRVIAGNYNQLVTSTNPFEIVLRQALCEALPQGNNMLVNGIVDTDKMLLDVMRKKLPSDSFLKLSLIDSVESKLKEPSTLAECSTTLRVYLQDLRIADGMLESLVRQGSTSAVGGRSRIQLNSLKIFQVLRTFVTHVQKLDTTLSTRIVLLGDITENMELDELVTWALRVLGLMADHVQQDKNMKQMFGSTAGPSNTNPKNTKGPQANAATPESQGKGKGKAKGSASEGSGQSQNPNKPPRQPQGKGPENPIPVTCKHFITDGGCTKGSACVFFHPRVGRGENKCYNCGSKEHGIKECTRVRPTPQQLQKRGNGRGTSSKPFQNPPKAAPDAPPSAGKGGGKKGSKGAAKAKAKPKASAASAEVEPPAEGARFCIRLKPKMKELIAEKCFVTGQSCHTEPFGSSANAGSREPDQSYALLDSGATHVILNLSKISQQGLREGRSIGIRLAAGKQVGKIYQGEIFLRGVKRSLCPLGAIVKRLQLKLTWHNAKCLLLARSSKDLDVWLPVIEPVIRNQLMYLSKDQFKAVRELLYDSRLRLDETFYYGRWEQLLPLPSEDDALAQASNVQPEEPEEPEERIPDTFIYHDNHTHSVSAKEILANTQRDKYVARVGEADEELHVEEGEEVLQDDDREAEYEEDDQASQATSLSFDQWEQRNAGLLNQDDYGFGLDEVPDMDDQLFDESGLQPDEYGAIPWDAVVPGDRANEVDEELAKELESHYAAGHVPKDPRCPVCQKADGPVRMHKNGHKELKQTHILTVDLMGPFPPSYPRKFQYALIGAYRGRVAETGLPSSLLPLSVPLRNKDGPLVAEAIRKAVLFVESVHTGLYEEGKRIVTVLSDRGSEFENRHVRDVLNDLAIFQSFTSGYSPQSSGAAEVNVRIVKQVIRRLLEAASFQVPWWAHALEYATQILQCRALSRAWLSPAFGEYVSVKRLEDKKKQRAFAPRGEVGRMLVARPITDRTCDILVGTRIVRGTTPRPVTDKLAESMTRDERRQVLSEVREELDEEVRNVWEPVLTPMGSLLWINKLEKYSQFRTPQFVQVESKEPIPMEAATAAAAKSVPRVISVTGGALVSFPTSKPAKSCLKSCVDMVTSKLLPRNTSRTSVRHEDDGFPRSVTLGLTVGRGYGIAHQTPQFPELLPKLHKLAATRPSKERSPYLSVQVSYMNNTSCLKLHYDARNDAECASWVISGGSYSGGLLWVEHPEGKYHPPREIWRTLDDAQLKGYMYDTNQNWVKLPARQLLHGVTAVHGCRVSMSYYVPSFLYSLDVSLAHTLDQLGFSIREWVKQNPESVYVPMSQDLATAIKDFPVLRIQETRGVSEIAVASSIQDVDVDMSPHAMAVQELQALPTDVDKHFSELAKAHPISMKAVRNTVSNEREKWKESMQKELKGLMDRETYEEVPSETVPIGQVQNAPARMVYVVKPAVRDDGSRFVKRKSRLVICGNFLNPYGETSTANLDVSVLRAVVTVGMNNGWKFASADIPQAFLYASIEEGRHVYLRPPKICVDFGLVPGNTLWKLKRALYGLRESPKLWEKKRDAVLSEMILEHKRLGRLRLLQSLVHSSLWLIVTQKTYDAEQSKRKTRVKVTEAATVIGDQVDMGFDLQFETPLGLLAVYVDDLLCAANLDVIRGLQASVDNQWKTGPFQVLGEEGCDELVYLGTQIEYDPMYPDQSVILLHQERYTYELMEKFPEYFDHAKKRAVPGSSEGFKDLCEPVDAPLSKDEQGHSSTPDLKLVRHLQAVGGSLLWLVIRTRPDMAWAYSRVASLITKHPQAALARMKEICRYLLYTGPMAMRYVKVTGDPLPPIDVYADISFAPQGQKSHEGLIVIWGGNVMSWKSGRQSLTATSTSEAELLGAANADEALKAMYLVLAEMTGSSRMPSKPCGNVWCDNQSAIAQTLAGSSSNLKTRHVSIKAHRLGEDIRSGIAELSYVQSESQRADSLTKAYSKPLMMRSYEHLGLVTLYDQTQSSSS